MRAWLLIRKILFQFDAETAHALGKRGVQLSGQLSPFLLKWISNSRDTVMPREFCGLKFLNPVGLAAGFDKNAEWLRYLPSLGFGFAEIGTVTPQAQSGNSRPRLWRLSDQESLFNRMGFNNLGAKLISERIRKVRPFLPTNFRVGINLGKNKSTALEDSAADFAVGASWFEGLADYLVINVSSPNTTDLRNLQTVKSLSLIMNKVNQIVQRWNPRPPVLIKLAPELSGEELFSIVDQSPSMGIQGLILTNTLAGEFEDLSGGWSGRKISKISADRLREVRARSRLPLISVGGIMDASDARLRFEVGADLIQVYSGWVFQGPRFVSKILEAIGPK